MKKIDLHIHTISTVRDNLSFTFCLNKLKAYVSHAKLDAIAITNHDLFDLEQFESIVEAIDIVVFPGIEVSLDQGHLLVIAENSGLEDFSSKCQTVAELNKDSDSTISAAKLAEVFGDFGQYLLIPHYDKAPEIRGHTLDKLRGHFSAGEVSSVKKFLRLAKSGEGVCPVIFSDQRVGEHLEDFSTRQTFLDCNELTLSSIKTCLRDKSKVQLSASDGNRLFQVFEDGQMLSTGLNVVLGKRSSGKSFMLDEIVRIYGSKYCKYLPQFSLAQREDSEGDEEFRRDLQSKGSSFNDEYLLEFKKLVDDIEQIDLEKNEFELSEFVESLLKHANEKGLEDAYSKAALFNEDDFDETSTEPLKRLIDAIGVIVENREYDQIIEKHIEISALKSLAVQLIELIREKRGENEKKLIANKIVRDIRKELSRSSVTTSITNADFYNIAFQKAKVDKFSQIVSYLREEAEIRREEVVGYFEVVVKKPFDSASTMKKLLRRNLRYIDAFRCYGDPYKFLIALREIDSLQSGDRYKLFVHLEHKILNQLGENISGGERSEYRLLRRIQDSERHEILLIDEPESSFDNIFLRNNVNALIKQISLKMPVVVVTHNNTIGATIEPDYFVHLERIVSDDRRVSYTRYSGYPGDKEFISLDGRSISSRSVLLDTLEAGEEAYESRAKNYSNLKN